MAHVNLIVHDAGELAFTFLMITVCTSDFICTSAPNVYDIANYNLSQHNFQM